MAAARPTGQSHPKPPWPCLDASGLRARPAPRRVPGRREVLERHSVLCTGLLCTVRGRMGVRRGMCVSPQLGVQACLQAQGAKCEAGTLLLGTEGPLVPKRDFHSQPESGGERGGAPSLPSAGSGVCRRLPLFPPSPKQHLCIFGRKSSLEPDQLVNVPAPLSYRGLNFQQSFHERRKP